MSNVLEIYKDAIINAFASIGAIVGLLAFCLSSYSETIQTFLNNVICK